MGVTIQNGLFSPVPPITSRTGGIENFGTLTVKNSTVAGNRAFKGGGGILNGAILTVENSTFADNFANIGGGGIVNGGTVTLTHVTFENNTPNDCTGCPDLTTGDVAAAR
jgi:hypothetical protein